MDFLQHWGIYAPLLFYVWFALAGLVAQARAGRQKNARSVYAYFVGVFPLAFALLANSWSEDRIQESWWWLYVFYVAWPLALISLRLINKEYTPGYRQPLDILLFRRPVAGAEAQPPRRLILPYLVVFTLPVMAAVLSYAGTELRTCGRLDIALGRSGCVRAFTYDGSVESVAFSPDGSTLAVGGSEKTAMLWRVATGDLLRTLTGHSNWVSQVAFSPDGRLLATGSWDNHVRLWRVDTGALQQTLTAEAPKDTIVSMAFSPDGTMIAAGVGWGANLYAVWLWRTADGTLLRKLDGRGYNVAFSPDSTILATSDISGEILLLRINDGTLVRTLTGHAYGVTDLAFSPDGQELASTGGDEVVRLWRVGDGQLLHTLTGHQYSVDSVAFSPDGALLATGGREGTTRLWRVADGQLLHVWPRPPSGGINSVMFAPDGKTVAAAASWETVRLWRVTP